MVEGSPKKKFEKIAMTKSACLDADIPIISIDTKKKEVIGNFKHPGQVYCSSFRHENPRTALSPVLRRVQPY